MNAVTNVEPLEPVVIGQRSAQVTARLGVRHVPRLVEHGERIGGEHRPEPAEIDDVLPYLLRYIGEDNLLLGTDYGHHVSLHGSGGDQSAQPQMIAEMKSREEVEPRLLDKILIDNPRRFYGL